jgi:hypothetical protein
MKDGGWLSKYNTTEAQNGIEGTMAGLTDQGFDYNGAWGGTMQMGGSIPGSVGFTYARTQDPAPSNGKYAKKTMASAQNGQEMKFYQEGLDWKPKNISRDGSSLPEAQGGTSLTQEEQQIIQDRKNRIKASVAARENGNYTKDNWRQQLADESQAIGDKFRIFPDDPNSIIDEYFNPAVTIGSMAADLGSAPLRAQQEDSYLPYASAIATPLVIGALEGFGVKSNKQFAKNIINPFNFPGQGYVKNVLEKTANKVSKAAGNFAQDFSKGYKSVPTREDGGWLSKYQEGGIIEDDRGQWEYPGEITKINSNQITMQGVDYPVLGISDTGDTQMMQPGQDYTYDGESVTEYPMMQDGGLMSYREPILNAKDRFVQKQMNKFGDAKFVNRALEIAEKQGYDYGADDGGPLDAVRHAAMSASVAKNLKVPKVIGKYAPALDDAIRMGAANLMGFGYELSNFNEGEGFLMDMKNNYIGSDIGVMKNLTDEERAKKIAGMLKYNKLSIDNTKKPKKENGGWLSKYN